MAERERNLLASPVGAGVESIFSGCGGSFGFSKPESDTERRMGGSTATGPVPIEMIGSIAASLESEPFLSLSFCIDRLTEPNPKWLFDGVAGVATGVEGAFLPAPKGRKERSVRKEGMPELAGVVGVGCVVPGAPGE